MAYTKLDSKITDSTVWLLPDPIRIVWITMLAMADQHGFIEAEVPGLANRARVPIEDCARAIELFKAPDPYSRTKEHEGRRIIDVDGGWLLINHATYRAKQTAAERAERARLGMAKLRKRRKEEADASKAGEQKDNKTPPAEQQVTKSLTSDAKLIQAEAEAEAEANPPPLSGVAPPAKSATPPPPPPPPDDEVQLATRPDDVSAQVWADFLFHRKAKRAPVTVTVLKRARIEAAKVGTAGIALEPFLELWCARGSQGLMGKWVRPEELDALGVEPADVPPERKSFRQLDIEAKRARWEEMTGRKWGEDAEAPAPLQIGRTR